MATRSETLGTALVEALGERITRATTALGETTVMVVTVATVGEGYRDEAQRHGHRKQQCQS